MEQDLTFTERLIALHEALTKGGIPHAFGGAVALAYWIIDPRGTDDIDINIFLSEKDHEKALGALPNGIGRPDDASEKILRDGQIRLWWDEVPVDLFFAYDPIHTEAAEHRHTVPYEGTEIPVLGPLELAVFKAIFDRLQDWADIENMIAAKTVDPDAVRAHLRRLLGSDDDRRFKRLSEVEREVAEKGPRPPMPPGRSG